MSAEEKETATAEAVVKAANLSASMGKKISPLIVTVGEELVIGYISEPTRQAKMAAMNALGKENLDIAGSLLLDCILLEQDSDPRIKSDDDIYISASLACVPFIKVYSAEIKKN